MTIRITESDLEYMVEQVNKMTHSPMQPWKENGQSHVGCYHLDKMQGRWALYRIVDEHGACRDISQMGHTSKRELYYFLHGMVVGLSSYPV